ncbi:MAG TPA: cystathionine gamma-synthase [Vitreimonas sp.]|uniref:cystathionine gamma-synthase n=1 Tax=Vitreimonas sp. TaxID=3069702 RepID=UPI002D226827|nr:cystathionine gamma-synthase [Vitreimonas sp.]HYD86882.1 cystathionine gamma-synthase [Vitreimonas sp.]
MSKHDETIACSVGINCDPAQGAVVPPLYLSANYSFAGYGEKRAFDYSRSGNPTRALLAEAIAELERGAGAVITSSGMSAVDLVLSLLPAGALVIAPHDCYGGTWRLFDARARRGSIRVRFIDQNDADAVGSALAESPALLWIETPSNPLMRVVDVAGLASRTHAAGVRVAVDNTFLSPALQKPIELGADFVVHSTTKYLNGHSDVVGGAVVAKQGADAEQLTWWANCTGVTGAPFDAWLTLRGLRTLNVRIAQQSASAGRLAHWLAAHSQVRKVHYPGLAHHAGHDIARRQQRGFGAMLSFELGQGDARSFLAGLQRFTLAESLGGVESLIAHPASMTHASMSAEARAQAGIGDNLFRLSIGLEHADDLIADLDHALASALRQAA